jgi:hypothetical protein
MRRVRAWWLLAILSVACPSLPGCKVVDHCPTPLATALDQPACCRNRVWFFLLGDFHPCHQLEDLRAQLIDAGYIKVYRGQLYHLWHFADELKKIHHADPTARFVIVGQGGSASAARDLACRACQMGIDIDLFVYLDDVGAQGPVPARHIIAIHGDKGEGTGTGAEASYCLADAGHAGAAGHPETLKVILRYVEPITASIPVVEYRDETDADEVPPHHDDWDFLQPDGNDLGRRGEPPILLAPNAPPASMRGLNQP